MASATRKAEEKLLKRLEVVEEKLDTSRTHRPFLSVAEILNISSSDERKIKANAQANAGHMGIDICAPQHPRGAMRFVDQAEIPAPTWF